ncbi:TPA: LacI family DNA-binding transcriptional regulator, partial [Vibrio vulnificus]|nr:LacI family DNA-binding transcriptional regulator [Vibrio vulnificus]HDY7979169.1 LacI family DNA-binding transcriptional regulator [Vibrio vulnificus]
MSKKLTILDIARLSGVGKSTVSRVLTNDPKVKPETRAKVEQVIQDSGYVPSKSAQSMRGGSQKVVGVIISRLDSPSENRAVGSMLNVLYQAGYDAVIMESQF